MGAREVEAQNARVVFRGDEALLARANLWCRYGGACSGFTGNLSRTEL